MIITKTTCSSDMLIRIQGRKSSDIMSKNHFQPKNVPCMNNGKCSHRGTGHPPPPLCTPTTYFLSSHKSVAADGKRLLRSSKAEAMHMPIYWNKSASAAGMMFSLTRPFQMVMWSTSSWAAKPATEIMANRPLFSSLVFSSKAAAASSLG